MLKSYRAILWLCIPSYIGWIGVLLARSWPTWDDYVWSSWPIFIMLMVGLSAIFPFVVALFLAVRIFIKQEISFYQRVKIFAVVVCSFLIMIFYYGFVTDGM